MARKPKSKIESNSLLAALSFCKIVTKSEGPINLQHILLKDHWAIASNGILSCGHKIIEDINCAPNADSIVNALSKCDEQISITQLDNKLSIKSGKFKVAIPCIDPTLLYVSIPDPSCAPLTNAFKEAVEAVGVLASETAQSIICASILISGASVIATDRHVILEYWHGNDLPIGIALPKSFAVAISKCNKNCIGFGFSNNSVTIHFDDESWLKSQIFLEPWPDIKSILDRKANYWPIPTEFYK